MNRIVNKLLILLVVCGLLFLLATYSSASGSDVYGYYIPFITKSNSIEIGTATATIFMWDEKYNESLGENFDRITPEIEGGYWWIYGLDNGWDGMDRIVEIAEANGQEILYHNLRWWWEAQPPDIRIWITEAMTRYPTITDWVVVNEGWGYCNQTISQIDESFAIAREVRPDARLWYNGLLTDTCEQEQAKRLVQEGLADAIGVQAHLDLNSDLGVFAPLLSWLRDTSTPWAITELDILIPLDNAYYRNLQAEKYCAVVSMFQEYKGEFITMWGVSDVVSWQAKYFPLPIATDYTMKPAWNCLGSSDW